MEDEHQSSIRHVYNTQRIFQSELHRNWILFMLFSQVGELKDQTIATYTTSSGLFIL